MEHNEGDKTATDFKDVCQVVYDAWMSKGESNAILVADIGDGRRPSMSQSRFEHLFSCFSVMKCWDQVEASKPWLTRVVYTTGPVTEISVDPNGANMEMVDSIVMCTEQTDGVVVRAVTKKTNQHIVEQKYTNVRIDRIKRFTFKSSFTWTYDFIVSYKEPYASPETDDEELLCFADKPLYFLRVTCCSVNDSSRGAQYLATSLKAKLADLRDHR